MRLSKWVGAGLVVLAFAMVAQAEINLHEMVDVAGEVRYRSELDAKDFNADTGMDAASTLRTTIGILVQPADDFRMFVRLREARFLGTQGTNQAPTAAFYATEAYFHLDDAFGSLGFRAGRYALMAGRSRILGSANYNVYGPRSYDAVGLYGTIGSGKWDAHLAKSTSNGTTAEDGARDLNLVIVRTSFADGKLQPYFVGYNDPRPLNAGSAAYVPGQQDADLVLTPAVYYQHKMGAIKLDLDVAGQFGSYADRDLSAYLLNADVSYAIDASIKPVIGVGLDYTSGTEASEFAAGEDHTFRAPYSARHTYRGYLDYFKDVNEGMANLIVRFQAYPIEKVRLNIDLHNFMYANEKASAATAGETYTMAGQEVDTRLRFVLHKNLKVDTAWCFMLPTEDYKPNGDMGHYFYIALTGTF